MAAYSQGTKQNEKQADTTEFGKKVMALAFSLIRRSI
jgi:hypothetical protein